MPLHPAIANSLKAAEGAAPLESYSIEEARRLIKATYETGVPKAKVASVQDFAFPGPPGDIPCRIYTPLGVGPHPVTMFFHGSGFCVLDLDSHDDICRRLCAGSRSIVVSVDYRLAPEAKFPAGSDDCIAAVRWFASHGDRFNADVSRMAAAGDSAGGCLVASTVLRLRDEGGPRISGQLLFYPVTDHYSSAWPTYRQFANGYGLTEGLMKWFWDHYLSRGEDASDPWASPLRAESFAGLPPALIQVAEYDVLRAEGEAYARQLEQAGVPARLERCEGLNHGFLRWLGIIPEATSRMDEACAWLSGKLHSAAS